MEDFEFLFLLIPSRPNANSEDRRTATEREVVGKNPGRSSRDPLDQKSHFKRLREIGEVLRADEAADAASFGDGFEKSALSATIRSNEES